MQPNRNTLTNAAPPLMYKHISWRFRSWTRHEACGNFFHQIRNRQAFLFLKDIMKFNSREIYLVRPRNLILARNLLGTNREINTRETQKFQIFLKPELPIFPSLLVGNMISTVLDKNYLDDCEKRRCSWHHKQCTTTLKDHLQGV